MPLTQQEIIMEYTGKTFFKAHAKDLSQADGAEEINVSDSLYLGIAAKRHWQVHLAVSDTPEGGVLTVSGKIPGSDKFIELFTLTMTEGDQEHQFTGIFETLKFSPATFDGDKIYDIFLAAS